MDPPNGRTRPAADDPEPPECAYPCQRHISAQIQDAACRAKAAQALPAHSATPQAHGPRDRLPLLWRVERPSSANGTIRARNTSRCCDAGDRNSVSCTDRPSSVSWTSAALGIIPMLDHESDAKGKCILEHAADADAAADVGGGARAGRRPNACSLLALAAGSSRSCRPMQSV